MNGHNAAHTPLTIHSHLRMYCERCLNVNQKSNLHFIFKSEVHHVKFCSFWCKSLHISLSCNVSAKFMISETTAFFEEFSRPPSLSLLVKGQLKSPPMIMRSPIYCCSVSFRVFKKQSVRKNHLEHRY